MSFFPESHGIEVNDSALVGIHGSGNNVSVVVGDKRKWEGIELLLELCVPEAIHDSGARGDLGCYPGTREEYIRNITSWGKGEPNSNSEKQAFLMTGQAGVGKSAIALTCANDIEASGKLGATFFFYRPEGWNDAKKFIPTLVYQLTTRYPAYRDCIDSIILKDRLVLQKAMDVQFRELLIKPFRNNDGHGIVKDSVIIVDGLDECATEEAQIEIVKVVTTSIHEQTTPFLWAFFSRPESPITSVFSSDIVATLFWKLTLPVTGEDDSDIELYVRASFKTIRAKNGMLEVAWPPEDYIRRLLSQSEGLFVYAVTALRYVDQLGKGTCGLEGRLRAVVQVGPTSTENPFSALDQLYLLIMEQIPEGVLHETMSLLFWNYSPVWYISEMIIEPRSSCTQTPFTYYSVFGVSSAAFYAAIRHLYSVLGVVTVTASSQDLVILHFYHQSFADFLLDERRSKQYSLKSPDIHRHCLKMLVPIMVNDSVTGPTDENDKRYSTINMFFRMISKHDGQLEEDILLQLLQVNWGYWQQLNLVMYGIDIKWFIQKIPKCWRRRIIRPSRVGLAGIYSQILANISPTLFEARAYIIGNGDGQALVVQPCLGDYFSSRPLVLPYPESGVRYLKYRSLWGEHYLKYRSLALGVVLSAVLGDFVAFLTLYLVLGVPPYSFSASNGNVPYIIASLTFGALIAIMCLVGWYHIRGFRYGVLPRPPQLQG